MGEMTEYIDSVYDYGQSEYDDGTIENCKYEDSIAVTVIVIKQQTEKAWLVEFKEKKKDTITKTDWFPKQHCEYCKDEKRLYVPVWLRKRKGLFTSLNNLICRAEIYKTLSV